MYFPLSLLGPYLIFLSSTINGYMIIFFSYAEGELLIIFLLLALHLFNNVLYVSPFKRTEKNCCLFKKRELSEPMRYTFGDPIETWLNTLLCLDVSNAIPNLRELPHSECDLYYVNRDILFSYHKDCELFLQRIMAIYVVSHYKNSPNDLQLSVDAPAHHLFLYYLVYMIFFLVLLWSICFN
uniref:UPF0202 protein At3g57940 family n=1 Tax=Cajanus cajan TaxID=3821 RepID=A0A151S1C8_CAJCA|nr:UPF0202 protein At3g57940 family [Cajanus cajan]